MPTNRSGHRTREHLRLIFRQIPGAVWATDRDLRLTYVHGQTARVEAAESERLVGRTVYDFVGSRAPTEPLVAHHLAALAGGHGTFLLSTLRSHVRRGDRAAAGRGRDHRGMRRSRARRDPAARDQAVARPIVFSSSGDPRRDRGRHPRRGSRRQGRPRSTSGFCRCGACPRHWRSVATTGRCWRSWPISSRIRPPSSTASATCTPCRISRPPTSCASRTAASSSATRCRSSSATRSSDGSGASAT